MKNLQIGINDLIGNKFNGHNLHNYLIEKGIESKHIVWNKQSNDINTTRLADFKDRDKINNLITRMEKIFGLQSILYLSSYELLFNKAFLDADIVHYHIIHDKFFSITSLPILTKLKPSIWTLHDPWAMAGHCVYPYDCTGWKTGCKNCNNLDYYFPIEQDTAGINWEIKNTIYKSSNVDVIVASKWMKQIAENSPLMSNFKIHHIPFGINLDIFKPTDTKKAKQELGISPETFVIGFRESSSEYKGLKYIKKCLHKLKIDKPICLLTTNEFGHLNELKDKYQIIEMGWVYDDNLLAKTYNAMDIFLMPSVVEAFGMMAIEAMACGKPVIIFDGTALQDIVFIPQGGISVPNSDTDALLKVTERLINNPQERQQLGENALKLAQENYDVKDYVNKIIDLYKEVIEKRNHCNEYKHIIQQLKKVNINLDNLNDNSENDNFIAVKNELDAIKSSFSYRVINKMRNNSVLRAIYRFLKRIYNKLFK